MKFIVCVKQVPDTSGKVAVKADGTMDRSSMAAITNPDDRNAVEAALTLKDQHPEAIAHLGLDEEDVIFCGRQAIDGDTAQVGPQIAEKLGLPQVTYAADIRKEGRTLTVRRMLEDGYMNIQVSTPCLITCIKELNTPRYMTVKGILECDQKPYRVLDYAALKDEPLIEPDTIGLKGSPTNVYKSFSPPVKGAGVLLEGSPKEAVAQLFAALEKQHMI